ncbi:DUF3455 domain-containing protein [Polyangium sp. y55x31]|uniref:DUF3455 domain-containing protein n=1 Tax=Polyangium sp. y55x31 TaxID=3042688 RepID=UPI0024825493|nr:DUF3455 domain-containing protein [Polyangium sp. y55x31]MDI1482777.1 DUF3455 domain-containing protein [Polyangium sp. y55x31]
MRTTTSLSLFALPLALGACVDQGALPGDLEGDDLAEETATIRITVLDHDDNGEQTEKVVDMDAREFAALTAKRRGAPAGSAPVAEGEGDVGTSAQALTVQSNAANCTSKGLLIYSQPNRGGEVLCLMTVGHEAAGTTGFSLPADWRRENGGKYPMSYWSGDDAGRFAAYFSEIAFGPWMVVNYAPYPATDAVYVYMQRLLGAPATDPSIAVPSNHPLVHKMAAKGHQIYVCDGSQWVLSAPSAVLLDPHTPFDVLGHHYAGPQWRGTDGSTIRGRKVSEVPSPDPNAIPWLKIEVIERSGSGVFSPIAFIQRVNTTSGKAPSSTCSAANRNQLVWVDYTADYYFYASPTAPAGWACSPSYYNGNDGCDCNCGMPDPDCVKENQTLYGCGGQCTISGTCVP